VLADERRALVANPCGAVARGEGATVAAGESDVVGVALRLVRHFVHVRLLTADAHAFLRQPLGGFGELLAALNLNHGFASLLFQSL
jgi:hypothetical protein